MGIDRGAALIACEMCNRRDTILVLGPCPISAERVAPRVVSHAKSQPFATDHRPEFLWPHQQPPEGCVVFVRSVARQDVCRVMNDEDLVRRTKTMRYIAPEGCCLPSGRHGGFLCEDHPRQSGTCAGLTQCCRPRHPLINISVPGSLFAAEGL